MVDSLPKAMVGIVTYIHTMNYGSILQAFALQEAVKKLGYKPVFIDHLDMSNSRSAKERVLHVLSSLIWAIRAPQMTLKLRTKSGHARTQSEEKSDAFSRFESENFSFFQGDYSKAKDISAFICGSDQVWSLSVPGLHRVFFLRFANRNERIAYAASFGTEIVPSCNKLRLARWLSDFDFISVREQSGVTIVRELTGKEVPQVLDPVLLVGKEFWKAEINGDIIVNRSHWDNEYILVYMLSDSEEAVDYLSHEADARGIPLLWIDTGVEQPNTAELVCPNPLEFVSLIYGAKLVATDSFHGLAFSLLFNKNFILINRRYETNSGQSTRVDSLLNLVSLPLGSPNEMIRLDSSNIEWGVVNQRLDSARSVSVSFLARALAEVCKNPGYGENNGEVCA